MNELAYGILFFPALDLILALKVKFAIASGLFIRFLPQSLATIHSGLRIALRLTVFLTLFGFCLLKFLSVDQPRLEQLVLK
jgi:uncharacterized membrane protein